MPSSVYGVGSFFNNTYFEDLKISFDIIVIFSKNSHTNRKKTSVAEVWSWEMERGELSGMRKAVKSYIMEGLEDCLRNLDFTLISLRIHQKA